MSSNSQSNPHAPADMQKDLKLLSNYYELIAKKTMDSIDKLIKQCYPYNPDNKMPQANLMYLRVFRKMLYYLEIEKKKVCREELNRGVSGTATAMPTDNYDGNSTSIFRHSFSALQSLLDAVENRVEEYFKNNPSYFPGSAAMAIPVLEELNILLEIVDSLFYGYAIRRRFTNFAYQVSIRVLKLYKDAFQYVVNENMSFLADAHKVVPTTMFDQIPTQNIRFG